MQDCQYKLSTSGDLREDNGYAGAIAYISDGIVYAIGKLRNIKLDELESKGLSAFDQFYADVSSLFHLYVVNLSSQIYLFYALVYIIRLK